MLRYGFRILALLCAAFSIAYLSFSRNPAAPVAETTQTQTTQAVFLYTLRDYNGMLALFEGESNLPLETFSILTRSLPPAQAELVRNGIGVNTQEELQKLLEDYTS